MCQPLGFNLIVQLKDTKIVNRAPTQSDHKKNNNYYRNFCYTIAGQL